MNICVQVCMHKKSFIDSFTLIRDASTDFGMTLVPPQILPMGGTQGYYWWLIRDKINRVILKGYNLKK